jgi:hypothetical protein
LKSGILARMFSWDASTYEKDAQAVEHRKVLEVTTDFLALDVKEWDQESIPAHAKGLLSAVRKAANILVNGYDKPADEKANEAKGYLNVTLDDTKKLVVAAWQ